MSAQWLGYLEAFLVLTLGLVNLLAQDWRRRVLAFAFQAIGVVLLCWQSLSLTLSLVKFIEGWMAAAILGTAMANVTSSLSPEDSQSSGVAPRMSLPFSVLVFRFATAILVGASVLGGVPYLMSVFNGIRYHQAFAILGLAAVGLLILSFRSSPFSIAIGLITILQAFEILLAVIEPSVMLNGLLAGVILGMAFLGAYLMFFERGQYSP